MRGQSNILPCRTLLIVLDAIIYLGGIMVSKCIHTRDHFYAYIIPEDIIRNHINTNLYKYTEGGGGENFVHNDKNGGDSMQFQCKTSNI